jgi:chromate transporter
VIAVVLQALFNLGRTALKTKRLIALAIAAAAANLLGVSELAVLFASGAVSAAVHGFRHARELMPLLWPLSFVSVTSAAAPPIAAGPLFLFFLKVGSVLFGSGYVLLAFLRGDLVERWGWMTESQLLDVISVTQLIPGPVCTAATFIGYVLAGWAGAAASTVGIFLPGFFYVAVSGPLVPRIRRSPLAGAFLDGLVVASLSIMAVVTATLARSALADPPAMGIGGLAALLLLVFRIRSPWLVLAGAASGLLLDALGLRG